MNNEELKKELDLLKREFEDFRKLHSHNGLDSGLIKATLPMVFDPASFINTSTPNSGFASFSIRHSVGTVELSVSGNGEGLGSQQVLLQTVGATEYFGLFVELTDIYVGTNVPVVFGSFTSAERDALTAQNGMVIYNTTTSKLQARAGGAWVDLH